MDWDSYSRTFQEWFRNQALVDVDVCLESLSPMSNDHQASVYTLRASQSSSTCQSHGPVYQIEQRQNTHTTGSWSMGPNRSSLVSSLQKSNYQNLSKVFLAYSGWLFMRCLMKNGVQRDEVFACLVFYLRLYWYFLLQVFGSKTGFCSAIKHLIRP